MMNRKTGMTRTSGQLFDFVVEESDVDADEFDDAYEMIDQTPGSAALAAAAANGNTNNHVVRGKPSAHESSPMVGAELLVMPLPGFTAGKATMGNPNDPGNRDDQTTWKDYAKMVVPHIGLAFLCSVYIVCGAAAFYYVERPHEEALRRRNLAEIAEARAIFLDRLWAVSEHNDNRTVRVMTYASWAVMVDGQLDNISRTLFNWYRHTAEPHPPPHNSTHVNWSFPAAIFFAASTVATIGYGNLTPVTRHGRILCVAFGLFGVPLMLVTIADLGKFIGDGILVVYGRYRHYRTRLLRRLRRSCSMYSAASTSQSATTGTTSVTTSTSDDRTSTEQMLAELAMQDEATVPVAWVTVIIVGYTALGGWLLPAWETDWSWMDAFYYSFITMSTVGFGDFVPRNEPYFWLTLPYIILGLAITTMAVDLVGSVYIVKIHRFGQKMNSLQHRMRTIGDMMAYQRFLRREYGYSQHDINRLPLDGINWDLYTKPYRPRDLDRIYFIDQKIRENSLHRQSMTCVRDDDLHSLNHRDFL